MAFSSRDITENVNVDRVTTSERILFERDRSHDDGGPKLNVWVIKEIDGVRDQIQVPRDTLIANWPGSAKSLKNWLLAILDAV